MLQDALNDLRSERKSLADRLEKVDAAIAATFALRERVAATAAEVVTRSRWSTRSPKHRPPTAAHPRAAVTGRFEPAPTHRRTSAE